MGRSLGAAAACLVFALGCGSAGSVASPDGGGEAGSTGTAGAGGAGGGNHMFEDGLMGTGAVSGSGSAGTAAPAGPGMLGSWVYAAGTTTRACPGDAPSAAAPEGGLTITAGNAGELVVTEACPLRFRLAGEVATIVSGQSCAGSDGAGGQVAFTKLDWTLTLSSDGRTLTESLAADEKLTPASGPSRTCRYTESGVTLRRP